MRRLTPQDCDRFPVCLHRTRYENLPGILATGLVPGGRAGNRDHHMFSPYEPEDPRYLTGRRGRTNVRVYADLSNIVGRTSEQGNHVYLSASGAICTRRLVTYRDMVFITSELGNGSYHV